MDIKFVGPDLPTSGVVFVGCYEGGSLLPGATQVDAAVGGAIRKAIKAKDFKGKKDKELRLIAPGSSDLTEVVVLGLGEKKSLSMLELQEIGGRIGSIAATLKESPATALLQGLQGENMSLEEAQAHIAHGISLKCWRFDKYQTKKKEEFAKLITSLNVGCEHPSKVKEAYEPLKKLEEGIFLTRHVVSEPANILYPESMVAFAKELKDLGVTVEILDEKDMHKLGMGALLGVGQGSERESRLIVLQWHGGGKEAPVAIVGKGVTFDSGGISIKPAADMDDMKWDMGGSGVVLGLMKALAGRKAKVNVVGVMGMVENMPSGSAQRPGDIVTSMSGQTIEVLNTDAEGRLVLADALWYTQDRFKPKAIVDLATLTGAIIVALGSEYAGLFSNNDELANNLLDASAQTGEKLWRLPLADAYDKDIDSPIADVKNIGSGRGAGSITAAQFLQRFVNKVPWAHLDIAGTTWDKKGRALSGKGATAFGVRLLNNFIQTQYES